jgi:hypothetical protein
MLTMESLMENPFQRAPAAFAEVFESVAVRHFIYAFVRARFGGGVEGTMTITEIITELYAYANSVKVACDLTDHSHLLVDCLWKCGFEMCGHQRNNEWHMPHRFKDPSRDGH